MDDTSISFATDGWPYNGSRFNPDYFPYPGAEGSYHPVWQAAHMESQVYLEYDGSALRSVAGISFINTFSEIRWKSIRGGSRWTISEWIHLFLEEVSLQEV